MDPSIDLLKTLVAIDSVNPSLVHGGAGEGGIARAIADHMRSIGLDVHVEEAAHGRPNVVGVLEGRAPGRSLMFCGHVDTVGVEGMADPFGAHERDGRLYGRGAQDMKGGVAAMIDAARVVGEAGLHGGRLIVAAVADEEFASVGAGALVRRWTADAAIVTEPTDLQIGVGHKGFAWLNVETRGRAAHGSRPAEGRDAILRMGRVLAALERLDRDLQARPPDPILGTGSLHASIISGGRELSVYPDSCRLRLERRILADEDGGAALRDVQDILAALTGIDPEFEAHAALEFWRPAHGLATDHHLPSAFRAAAASSGIETRFAGLSFWTDAAVLAAAGIPAVIFGPGGAGLHSVEEYVTIGDVLACRDVLARFAREWCGSGR